LPASSLLNRECYRLALKAASLGGWRHGRIGPALNTGADFRPKADAIGLIALARACALNRHVYALLSPLLLDIAQALGTDEDPAYLSLP
jgi:hypothetical protein